MSRASITWGLGRIKVSGRFVKYGRGWRQCMPLLPDYTLYVADIVTEALDEITFTEVDVPAYLRQLVKRVSEWLCDYNRVIRLFMKTSAPPNHSEHAASRWPTSVIRATCRKWSPGVYEGGGSDALEKRSRR